MEEIKAKILNFPMVTVGIENVNSLKVGFKNVEVKGAGDYPFYKGEYVITPAVNEQKLETEKTVMREDLTVLAIPYAEVANTANGKTVTIG